MAGYLSTREEGEPLFSSDDDSVDVEVADLHLRTPEALFSGVGGGRKPMEYYKPQGGPSAEYNPIQADIDINSVPGRYDNLPRLQSVYGDTRYELHPWQAHEFDWEGQRTAGSLLERQYKTLTPHETPLSYGILPNMKRGTGVMLRDPDTGDMLKPQKKENLDTDMFVAHGDPLPVRDNRVNQGVTSELRQRAREQSKYTSGSGALNDFMPVDGIGGEGGGVGGPLRGFSTGEVMSRRNGGFHPRERFHRVDETKHGRNQHTLRSLNPSQATWNPGSIYPVS